jgi:large subunit ribosomal protein L29
MKAREIWEMMPEEIEGKLEDAYAEMFNLRFQFATGQMQNNARLRQMRREIARLNTILRAKQLRREKAGTAPASGELGAE